MMSFGGVWLLPAVDVFDFRMLGPNIILLSWVYTFRLIENGTEPELAT